MYLITAVQLLILLVYQNCHIMYKKLYSTSMDPIAPSTTLMDPMTLSTTLLESV